MVVRVVTGSASCGNASFANSAVLHHEHQHCMHQRQQCLTFSRPNRQTGAPRRTPPHARPTAEAGSSAVRSNEQAERQAGDTLACTIKLTCVQYEVRKWSRSDPLGARGDSPAALWSAAVASRVGAGGGGAIAASSPASACVWPLRVRGQGVVQQVLLWVNASSNHPGGAMACAVVATDERKSDDRLITAML